MSRSFVKWSACRKQVLDLDGDVIAEQRKFAVQRFDDRKRMRRPIEEIRIAKGNVLGAGVDLPANIFEHDFLRHYAEDSVVDGNDGAVPAEMFASPAGLGVARDFKAPFGHQQMCILSEGRQAGSDPGE